MEFFTHVTLLAAGGVVLVQELLKLLPTAIASRYPVLTNILLSLIAAIVAVWQANVTHPAVWTDWLLLVGTISVVAAIVYNQLIGKRNFLR